MGREQPAPKGQSPDEEPLIDVEALGQWLRLVPRAARRRKWLALGVFLLTMLMAGVAASSLPKTYRAHVRILASPLEGSPGTIRPQGGAEKSELAQATVDVVRSHAALRELIHSQKLVEKWEATRTPLFRLKDSIQRRLIGHELSEAELEEALAFALEKRLVVTTADHVVDIGVSWPDPESARTIVEELRERFIQSRADAELAALNEKASALESQVTDAKRKADETVAALSEAMAKKRKGAKSATVRGLQAEGRWRDLPDSRLSELRTQIIAQRKAIAEREDVQRKRIAELKAEYAEQKANLGPDNPLLRETGEKLAAITAGTPELEQLRRDETAMVSEFVQLGGKDSDLALEPVPNWPTELATDDPQLNWLKAQVELQSSALASAMRAAVDARVAMAAAKEEAPERYAVLQPALVPREPTSPGAATILGGGLFAGVVLALLASLFFELRRGRIEEPWQAQRWLGIPTLAVVPAKRESGS